MCLFFYHCFPCPAAVCEGQTCIKLGNKEQLLELNIAVSLFDKSLKLLTKGECYSKLLLFVTLSYFSWTNVLSMECPPAKNYFTTLEPNWSERGKTPIALQTENLPPTKSQNPKTFYGAIPNYPVSLRLVEHAHMCLLIISSVFWLFSLA